MRSLIIQKKRSQFDLLTFAGHTFGSTEELPPPPLCLGQGDPCNIFRLTLCLGTDISVLLFMLFLCVLLGHPRHNCVDLSLGSVHLPVATNKEPPRLVENPF